jgi:cold shock CspA family protein
MGKSQETFSKKEREKKRQKKQEEKRQKREERKSESVKGKNWEDMIAYVDEYGRITDTPPDPARKVDIDAEEILIGTPKEEDREPVQREHKGIITYFNHDKGYGFIRDQKTQASVFVHINQLSAPAKEGDKVTFEVERGPKGMTAVRVKANK